MLRRARVLVALVALIALTAGCLEESEERPLTGGAPAARSTPTDLGGRTFVVTEARDAAGPRGLAAEVRFSFDDGRVSVTTGCNALGGTWLRAGDEVTFGDLSATEIGCEPARLAQERWLWELMAAPMTVGESTFSFGDTVLTVADRKMVHPDAGLTGQRWELDTMVTGETARSVPADARGLIRLAADGTLTARLGCNRGVGEWSRDDDTLEVSLGSTRALCTGEQGDVEAAMNAVLSQPMRLQLTERRLDLTTEDGTAGLGFVAR